MCSTSRRIPAPARRLATDYEPDAGGWTAPHAPAVGEPVEDDQPPATDAAAPLGHRFGSEAGAVIDDLAANALAIDRDVDADSLIAGAGMAVAVRHQLGDEQGDIARQLVAKPWAKRFDRGSRVCGDRRPTPNTERGVCLGRPIPYPGSFGHRLPPVVPSITRVVNGRKVAPNHIASDPFWGPSAGQQGQRRLELDLGLGQLGRGVGIGDDAGAGVEVGAAVA